MWFMGLPCQSTNNFWELSSKFLAQFAANKGKRFMEDDMHDIKQEPGQTLKAYLARFNNGTVKVVDPDQRTFVSAFIKGIQSRAFNESLE